MGILNPRRFALARALFALSACGGLTRVDSSTLPVDGGSAIDLPGPSVVISPPTVVPLDAGEAALEGGSDMHLSRAKEAASPACDPGTLGASTYAVGTGPAAIAAGDLDGDKKMDLVVANAGSNDVTVLLSTTGYSPPARYAVGNTPKALAVGDLDGDGRPDVVVADDLDQTVSVLLNQGSNSLAPAVTYAAASYPDSIAISDVDGDGKPDIVVANGGSDDISVLLGNGDGTFQLQNEYGRMITQAWSLAMADLNGDGHVDAVVASGADDGLAVLVGAGDGSFGGQQSYPAEQDPVSVALGDVNGDGRLDAVVANEMTYNVSVLLGTGMAGFGAPTSYPITAVATSVALADSEWRRRARPPRRHRHLRDRRPLGPPLHDAGQRRRLVPDAGDLRGRIPPQRGHRGRHERRRNAGHRDREPERRLDHRARPRRLRRYARRGLADRVRPGRELQRRDQLAVLRRSELASVHAPLRLHDERRVLRRRVSLTRSRVALRRLPRARVEAPRGTPLYIEAPTRSRFPSGPT